MGRAYIAFTLVAGLFALPGSGTVVGQESTDCEVTELGTLSDDPLEATGRWANEDCDSRFRAGSGAHTYSFEVATPGRVRIDLKSAGADPYLYLLAEDGSRIADNDDGGGDIDARVERDLQPGTYLVEATTVGGRSRGPADFTISVSYVSGCEPTHLGTLAPGADLTASGSWTLDTCGSRFVVEHPAHGYTFNLEQGGRVRIDLTSENGDPVMSLATLSGGIIGANDDGGESRNARIDQYLPAGGYFIEATTYLEREYQPLRADFKLSVHLVDEQAEQLRARLKVEDAHVPPEVVAGDPFPVHYRAGNLGGDLAFGGYALLYVVGPRVFEISRPVAGPWQAGVSYHSGSETASAGSTSISAVAPFEVTFDRPGPSWVFVAVVTYDRAGNEIGFHGLWHNLMVLSSPVFEPVDVRVDRCQIHRGHCIRQRRGGHDRCDLRHRLGSGPAGSAQSDLYGGRTHPAPGRRIRAAGDRGAIGGSQAGPGHRGGPVNKRSPREVRAAIRFRRRSIGDDRFPGRRGGAQSDHGRGFRAAGSRCGILGVRMDVLSLALAPESDR